MADNKDMSILEYNKEQIKKGNLSTYIVLMAALGAMTFFGVCTPSGSRGLSGVAAKVDSETVSFSEFKRAYDQASRQQRAQNGNSYGVAASVLRRLAGERALFITATDMGILTGETDVIRYLTEVKAFYDEDGNFSDEFFGNYLRNNGYTEETFTEEVRRGIALQRMRELITSSTFVSNKAAELDYRLSETKRNVSYLKLSKKKFKVEISSDEVEAFLAAEGNKEKVNTYYVSRRDDYRKPEKVEARHILVSFQGARSASGDALKRSKEDALKRANEIYQKVKAGKKSFEVIAKAETDEPSGKKSGGDLGYFTREAMVPEFSDAAFGMKVGDISKPVESPFGYHVIKVTGRQEKSDQTLEQATDSIARTLITEQKAGSAAKDFADKILADLKAGKNVDAEIKKKSLAWRDSGDFALSSPYVNGLGRDDKVIGAAIALSKVGGLNDTVLESGDSLYILKLKSKKDADMKGFNDDKRETFSRTQNFRDGFGFFSVLESEVKKSFEAQGKIELNQDYLTLDEPNTPGV